MTVMAMMEVDTLHCQKNSHEPMAVLFFKFQKNSHKPMGVIGTTTLPLSEMPPQSRCRRG